MLTVSLKNNSLRAADTAMTTSLPVASLMSRWKRTFSRVKRPGSPAEAQQAITKISARAWTPAYDGDGQVRDGAWVAELTGLLDLAGWPKGMRVIVRRERPHPGAQLRFIDIDGHPFTAFATSTRTGQLADLELRHRRRARCEDRIRCAKDTGLRSRSTTAPVTRSSPT